MTPGQGAPVIVVADDHPLVRDALARAIERLDSAHQVALAGDLAGVERLLAAEREDGAPFDLVLLDLNMPGNHGLSGLMRLRGAHADIPVVIVSATEEPAIIRRALQLGASGYIPKSASGETIREAISAVLAGDIWVPADIDLDAAADPEADALARRMQTLTPQQARVLGMLGEGLLNKQIAYELGVSEATVKAHVSAILAKLDVDSRTQAVIALGRMAQDRAE